MSAEWPLHRSYLYAPGSRPDVLRKALDTGADAAVLDLEDAVPADAKDAARDAVAAVVGDLSGTGPDVHVRINGGPGDTWREDLEAVVRPGLAALRLPKVESAPEVTRVADALDRLEPERGVQAGSIGLYPTVESARGVAALADVLRSSPRVCRPAIGTTDLLADLGASGDDDLATLTIRSQMVLECRLAAVGPPVDSVHTRLDDEAGLRAGAERARSLGFFGKSVIHPRQLAVVHEVFTPTEEQLAWADRVLGAFDRAEADGQGAVEIDGDFVDAAVVARARALHALRRS